VDGDISVGADPAVGGAALEVQDFAGLQFHLGGGQEGVGALDVVAEVFLGDDGAVVLHNGVQVGFLIESVHQLAGDNVLAVSGSMEAQDRHHAGGAVSVLLHQVAVDIAEFAVVEADANPGAFPRIPAVDIDILVVQEAHHLVVAGVLGIKEVVLPHGGGILFSVVTLNGVPAGAGLNGHNRIGGGGIGGSGIGGSDSDILRLFVLSAAGCQGQDHSQRQENSEKLFHFATSFLVLCVSNPLPMVKW